MKPIYFLLGLVLALGGCTNNPASSNNKALASDEPRLSSTAPRLDIATPTTDNSAFSEDIATPTTDNSAFSQDLATPTTGNNALSQDIAALAAGNNTFAFDLYHAIAEGEDNLIYSPYSLYQALAMVYAGARGETAQEMANTLHFTLPQERLNPAFKALDLDLKSRASPPTESKAGKEGQGVGFELNIANAVWAQQGYPYKSEYLDLLTQNYGADLKLADFPKNAQAVVEEINHWVSEATQGRIPGILYSLDSDTRLVLANAVYFNAGWALPFDVTDTKPGPFHLLDGSVETVEMMHQTFLFPYTEGQGYQAIELSYANPEFGMLIILPREGQFREIEEQLTGEWVQGVLNGFRSNEVILNMPKFQFETPVIPLRKILLEMGMPEAFSANADFSGITEEQFFISEVVHKAFIQVDEKKTKAAAASGILMGVGTGEQRTVMHIDRPFFFLIHDNQTNTILFVGRVMDPV
jgi:serine protease inhibitor